MRPVTKAVYETTYDHVEEQLPQIGWTAWSRYSRALLDDSPLTVQIPGSPP